MCLWLFSGRDLCVIVKAWNRSSVILQYNKLCVRRRFMVFAALDWSSHLAALPTHSRVDGLDLPGGFPQCFTVTPLIFGCTLRWLWPLAAGLRPSCSGVVCTLHTAGSLTGPWGTESWFFVPATIAFPEIPRKIFFILLITCYSCFKGLFALILSEIAIYTIKNKSQIFTLCLLCCFANDCTKGGINWSN